MNQLEYEELEIEPKGTQEVTIQNEKDIRYGMTLEVPIFTQETLLMYLDGLRKR